MRPHVSQAATSSRRSSGTRESIEALVALEARGERVDVAAVAFPGEHLEVAVEVVGGPADPGRPPGDAVVERAVHLGPPHVAQLSAHHDVQVHHVADGDQVGGQHGGDPVHPPAPPAHAVVAVAHDLARELARPGRARPPQAVADRLGVGEQDDRRPPARAADGRPRERVAEHRHQPPVGGDGRRAQVRTADLEPVGVPRPGQVGDLVGERHAGPRSTGQLMHRGPPRPRPSSPPGMSSTSMPCPRRNVLVVTLRS